MLILLNRAPVAQLDRASGYEPEGREFESPRARHSIAVCFRWLPSIAVSSFRDSNYALRSEAADRVFSSVWQEPSSEKRSLPPVFPTHSLPVGMIPAFCAMRTTVRGQALGSTGFPATRFLLAIISGYALIDEKDRALANVGTLPRQSVSTQRRLILE